MLKRKNLVEVSAHTRDGHRVSSYVRSRPGSGVKLYDDGKMKPDVETVSKMNDYLEKAFYASTGARQGLSLGFADEIEGAMGGTGYALGSLNKDWNKRGESFYKAYNRGYKKYRDEHRGYVKEGYERVPGLMTISELTGAIANPSGLLFRTAKTTPLGMKARKNLLEAVATGGAYGVGTSEGGTKDYAKNIGLGILSSYGGQKVATKFFGKGNSLKRKNLLNQAININLNNIANETYKKLFDDEE